jgi:hypothetical protein
MSALTDLVAACTSSIETLNAGRGKSNAELVAANAAAATRLEIALAKFVTETEVAEVQRLEAKLGEAQYKSSKAADAAARASCTTRARSTTARANWAKAAELRDKIAGELYAAHERLRVARLHEEALVFGEASRAHFDQKAAE